MAQYTAAFVASRIRDVLKSKDFSAAKMLSDCGINKNLLNTMTSKGHLPRTEYLAQIADYLDVSIDYLLGRTDECKLKGGAASLAEIGKAPASEISKNGREMLSYFEDLSDHDQTILIGEARLLRMQAQSEGEKDATG